ncbi:hypothetical protein OR61_19790 [Xanthomonas vesicatoria]|nr:hypothetical protein OR61_19790 [Xanthomonas vesicatoria]
MAAAASISSERSDTLTAISVDLAPACAAVVFAGCDRRVMHGGRYARAIINPFMAFHYRGRIPHSGSA